MRRDWRGTPSPVYLARAYGLLRLRTTIRMTEAQQTSPVPPLLLVCACAAAAVSPSAITDSFETPAITEHVLARLQEARAVAGAKPLERRRDLDLIALERAKSIARRPESERMRRDVSVDRLLADSSLDRPRRSREHVYLQKNHPSPADGVFDAWAGQRAAWAAALSIDFDGIGIATVRSSDRWLVFVAILVDDPPTPAELLSLEDELFESINAVRSADGLVMTRRSAALDAIARAHSADMGERDFFAHENPEGLGPADRLESAGEGFSRVTENIFRTDAPDDLVRLAVDGWLSSAGHRANILDEQVTESGIGIVRGDDGFLYFTQLFRRPSAHGETAP